MLQPVGDAAAQAGPIQLQVESRTEEAESANEVLPAVPTGDRETEFILAPVPIVDPTIGNGLSLAGLVTCAAGDEADTTATERRATLALAVACTNTDSWMVGGGLKLYLDHDHYMMNLGAGYGNLNLKWFCTSSDSPFFENPIEFRTRGVLVDGNAQRRIVENVYLGVSGRYLRPTASVKVPIDVLPTLKANFDLAAIGMVGEYDSRDNAWYPASGSLGTLNFLDCLEALGSDREFGSLEATFSHYTKLAAPLVLAGVARIVAVGNNAPFFMLSTVNLRGFPTGQYMDRTAIQLQAELRWEGWRRILRGPWCRVTGSCRLG